MAKDPLILTHPLAVMSEPLPPRPFSPQLLPPQSLHTLPLPLPPDLLLRQPPQVRLGVREELVHEVLIARFTVILSFIALVLLDVKFCSSTFRTCFLAAGVGVWVEEVVVVGGDGVVISGTGSLSTTLNSPMSA